MILATLEQTFLVYPLVLGIYLTYHILKTTDLTAEGSFVLGAALYGRLLIDYNNHPLAIICALLGGALCGACVFLMQRKGAMSPLVSGIIMLFMLYSINLQIMGKPNINLLGYDIFSDFSLLGKYSKTILIGILNLFLVAAIALFLKTRKGLSLRAFGYKGNLVKKYGQNPETLRLLGLVIANSLAALSGVLTSQLSGYSDIHMGLGMALVGIGGVVIGQRLLSGLRYLTFNPTLEILACFGGIYLYFLFSHILLSFDIDPINLRLFLGIILVICLRSPTLLKRSHHA